MLQFIQQFPKDMLEITRLIRQQRISFKMEHKGLENMLATHDQISNRISFSIIIASLIIGSALIVISETPPLFYGISLIGIIAQNWARSTSSPGIKTPSSLLKSRHDARINTAARNGRSRPKSNVKFQWRHFSISRRQNKLEPKPGLMWYLSLPSRKNRASKSSKTPSS